MNILKFSFFRFVRSFSNVFSNVIILIFSYGTITICCMLLLILVVIANPELFIENSSDWLIFSFRFSKSINSGHTLDIVHPCVPLTVVVKWIYFYCYFGDNVTSRFAHLHNIIYQCDWFLYPIEIQKDLAFIMSNAQKPVLLHGFANIYCTKIIFRKVSARYQWNNWPFIVNQFHLLNIFLCVFGCRL